MVDYERDSQAAAMAALSLCESLALALAEEGILGRDEVRGLFRDAMETHRAAVIYAPRPEAHLRAAELIAQIVEGLDRLPVARPRPNRS